MRRLVMIALGSLFFLAACQTDEPATQAAKEPGQEAETPSAGSAPDPCTLLTSAEIQEVLGEAIQRTEKTPSDDPSVAQCIIDTSQYPGRLLVEVSRHSSEEEASASFKSGAEGAEPIAGIGDEATLTSEAGEFEIRVRKALSIILITLVADDPAGRDRVIAITSKVLARL